MADALTDLDPDLAAADAIDVWCDLESALAGKNGYGGDVAEIYAYRLVPPQARHHPQDSEQARTASANMTRLLRRFLELHGEVTFSIEECEGFRVLDLAVEEFPPFSWRVHLCVTQLGKTRAAPSIHELRKTLAQTAESATALTAMLDELATYRARERLGPKSQDLAGTDDLPPDGATGLYLDRSIDADDLEWIKLAWDAYLSYSGGSPRPSQLMLVFQAIRRDERATAEFLRIMNTVVLPLCRRLRLKDQPYLSQLGAANE